MQNQYEKNNNQVNNKILGGGGWKARGIPKGVFWLVLARKAKKGKTKRQAGRTGLTWTEYARFFYYRDFWHIYFILPPSKAPFVTSVFGTILWYYF